MDEVNEVKFTATLANASAVTFTGDDGDAKIKFEAPASEIAEVTRLIAYCRGIALEVTVAPLSPTMGGEE